MRRRIALFTSSRGDLGPLGPVLRALNADPRVQLMVIATGTHVVDNYGGRLDDIQLTGDDVLEVLDAGLEGTLPTELGDAYGRIAAGTSRILGSRSVEVLVLLGDRWELLAAAGAALLHGVPIAHLHGGETTEGAIDERIRHGVTKLADLHLCASDDSARRIRNLGEEPWRIIVTGAPGLDRLRNIPALSETRVEQLLSSPCKRPFGLVVYHPTTVDRTAIAERSRAVFEASAEVLGSGLILFPGADPGSELVSAEIERAVARHSNLSANLNLGEEYVSAMKVADVLIGNSSSGIIEAASLQLPVVDVGDRQKGRLRPRNVIHVDEDYEAILAGVRQALDDDFRNGLADLTNPYGDGRASERIVEALLEAPLARLARKPLMESADREIDLDALTVDPGSTLRETLATIQRSGAQIAFVTDRDNRLLGSISDGDVRRALLAGADLGDEISPYVNLSPVAATSDDDLQKVASLMERNSVAQVPVIDEQGRLVGVHLMREVVRKSLDDAIIRTELPDSTQ